MNNDEPMMRSEATPKPMMDTAVPVIAVSMSAIDRIRAARRAIEASADPAVASDPSPSDAGCAESVAESRDLAPR